MFVYEVESTTILENKSKTHLVN